MFPILPWERLLMALWPQGRPEYTHQRLGVPQISQKLCVHMFPILPWERLLMALWPQGRPEHMLSGRDLQRLLPPSLGSQQRIPTWRGVALVKASLSKTKCPVVRNSVKPIPGWDMFQIDWGTGFYLQWPKGPSTQDQYWCSSMLGRMILFRWTVVFMPITHVCRHMWWPLIPEDHLSPWAMIYWMTSHMVSFARRPLKAEWGWFVVPQLPNMVHPSLVSKA